MEVVHIWHNKSLWCRLQITVMTLESNVQVKCTKICFPYGVSGQVWYLIVLVPDLCLLEGDY